MRKIMMSKYIYCLLLIYATLISCKEENEFPVDKSYERMFRPHTIVAENITATNVTLKWPIVKGTAAYVVDLAKGTGFDQIVKTIEINTDELVIPEGQKYVEYNLSDLIGVTDYSVRVKTTSKAGIPDSEYSTVSFSTPAEQIMLPFSDLEYTSVIIKWKAGLEVTHINITAAGGQVQKVEITDEEKTVGEKSLTNLKQGTIYLVEIYNTEANKRGNVTFTTPSLTLPTAEQVIFLKKTDVLDQATIDTLTKSPVIVFPAGGVFSNNSTLVLKDNLSITFFGEPLSPMPILAWNGVTLPATAGTIRFENLNITGFLYEDGVETTTKRSYIFNQSVASQTEAVVFENCKIRNFANTPFRIQSSNPITVEKLIFNNCIAFDCGVNAGGNGNYSFIHNSVATGKINNIEITNSTLYNIGYSLILHNLSGSESVKIEKCTFNEFVGDNRYTIDYNNQVVGTFSLANCILGKTRSPANTASGIRIAGGAVTATNSYKTTDFIATTQATKVIGGLLEYSKASTDLFVDAANGDFNFKDQNFEGKASAGDPRWK